MNETGGLTRSLTSLTGIIKDNLSLYLRGTTSLLILTFSLPSIIINIINVFIFINTRVTDSITVCFLTLAAADLCSMLLLTVKALCSFFVAMSVSWSSSLDIISFSLGGIYSLSSDFSSAVTTYIALQRGLCVALPFMARILFTKNKSLKAITAIFIFLMLCALPRMLSFRVVKSRHRVGTNSSAVLIISFLESWVVADGFYLIFVKTVLVCLEYCTMILCAAAIFVGLRSSIELKYSSSASSKFENHRNIHNQSGSGKHAENIKREGNLDAKDVGRKVCKTEKKRESKETAVVKQSLLVVLIQVICTTPRVTVCLYQFFEPRFQIGKQYHNLFYVVYLGMNVVDSINAFLNFFVYFRLNSKFRNHFKLVFKTSSFVKNTKL
ncbi:chemosensory receptor c [Plakobranchus ocellatus]|uniref:Chemosensory receptor c n=1 Tax=Plakobranchus ocellatus TaxID=259542 RepID=A0AAV3ZFD1_9GAST|nr:chemosensory receptor c [Plakobranchus ocellatus]